MNHEDYSCESIDCLDYLKKLYPSSFNSDITSILFCQDEDNVWLEMTTTIETPFGLKDKKETVNLDYITEDNEYALYEDIPLYNTLNSIEENADRFLHDAETLYQTTDILINDEDISDEAADDDIGKFDLSENDELQRILLVVEALFNAFMVYISESEKYSVSRYRDYVLNSLNSFISGHGLPEFSFSIDSGSEDDRQWISFETDGNCLNVSNQGYIYTPGVGGDSYTNWMFTVWSGGQMEGDLLLSEDYIIEMIQNDAWLDIELPDEYYGFIEQKEE